MSETQKSQEHQHKRHPRFDYRTKQHQSAHAQATAPAEPIPQHPLIPRNHPALIDRPAELGELIEHIRQTGHFAYDSEFIGEMSYVPKLCLIQVATPQRVALVDPLAQLDLMPFWSLVADSSIEKIVHCGQQDLEPVFRQLQRAPARIFDTQIAAGLAGLAYPVSLSKLVRELTGVHLGKGFTFTHWDHRPLSSVQMRYAADDVRYLPALREALGKRLEELGHAVWVEEESASLCDPALYRPDMASDFMRVRGAQTLGGTGLAVLRELYAWREEAAKAQDVPPRTYLRDEILLEMARKPVTSVPGLSKVRGLPRPVEISDGQKITNAVQRGLTTPEAQQPASKHIEETPAERFGIDSLWAMIAAWCAGQSADPALVTSRAEAARLYRELHEKQSLDDDGRLMRGWRGELLGRFLQDFLRGQNGIHLQWREGALRSEPSA